MDCRAAPAARAGCRVPAGDGSGTALRPFPASNSRLRTGTNTNRESVAYRSFSPSEFEARGVRKVTTGITGLWRQAFIATLLLILRCSALPIIVADHQVLDCSPTNREPVARSYRALDYD
ncbi:hypothetical protein K1719_047562 [Acacia pycnantha]|nr:hypothetical protein K1719_047562 [Acacia pycnantha]